MVQQQRSTDFSDMYDVLMLCVTPLDGILMFGFVSTNSPKALSNRNTCVPAPKLMTIVCSCAESEHEMHPYHYATHILEKPSASRR